MPLTVTVGVDGSPQSLAAVDWAAREAELRGLPLRVVNAWQMPYPLPEAPEAREALEHWARRVPRETGERVRRAHPSLELTVEQTDGRAGEVLSAAAEGSALLVLGSEGLSGMAGYLVGSIGHLLLGEVAGTPLVFVRSAGSGGREPVPDGPVVVGVSDGADAPLGFAFEAADRRGCPVRAVHAWRVPGYFGYGLVSDDSLTSGHDQREAARLADLVRPWRERYPAVPVHEETVAGRAVDALTDASDGGALLVVGHRTRRLPVGARAGSITYGALHHVPIPVAVVSYR
ncbi:universal stress protein [Streptomyces sp. NPDC057638]|uniref:universal stress protein n=1 Tax=Streptomyces sp. NPDC057638 TaxID=3346190 RepID=UPI0036C4FF44